MKRMINSIQKSLLETLGLINSRTLGVVGTFTAKVIGAGFAFLFNVMLARILGSDGMGVYFLALTIITIGATIALLGLDKAVLRFAAVAHDQGDRPAMAALYLRSNGIVIVSGIVIALVVWLFAPFLPLGGERSSDLQSVLPVMLIALVPTALILLQGEFFKATGAPGTATIVQAVTLPLFLVVGTAVLFGLGGATVNDIVLLYVVATITVVLLAGAVWKHRMPGIWQEQGHLDILLLLRTSLPMLWIATMNIVMSGMDILVLGFWTDSATVGVYGVAKRISTLTAFILIAVNSVTAPRFAALYAQGNREALERLAQRSAFWMLLAASPVFFSLLLFPGWILNFFGTDFVGGVSLLRILAFGQLVNVATGSVGYLLIMTGYGRLVRNSVFFAILINLVGLLAFVPIFGVMAAAFSTAIALSVKNILNYWQVWKKMKINVFHYFKTFTGNN